MRPRRAVRPEARTGAEMVASVLLSDAQPCRSPSDAYASSAIAARSSRVTLPDQLRVIGSHVRLDHRRRLLDVLSASEESTLTSDDLRHDPLLWLRRDTRSAGLPGSAILLAQNLGRQPSTRIQLCGRLAVELAGRDLTPQLPGGHARVLFTYLHRSPVAAGASGSADRGPVARASPRRRRRLAERAAVAAAHRARQGRRVWPWRDPGGATRGRVDRSRGGGGGDPSRRGRGCPGRLEPRLGTIAGRPVHGQARIPARRGSPLGRRVSAAARGHPDIGAGVLRRRLAGGRRERARPR